LLLYSLLRRGRYPSSSPIQRHDGVLVQATDAHSSRVENRVSDSQLDSTRATTVVSGENEMHSNALQANGHNVNTAMQHEVATIRETEYSHQVCKSIQVNAPPAEVATSVHSDKKEQEHQQSESDTAASANRAVAPAPSAADNEAPVVNAGYDQAISSDHCQDEQRIITSGSTETTTPSAISNEKAPDQQHEELDLNNKVADASKESNIHLQQDHATVRKEEHILSTAKAVEDSTMSIESSETSLQQSEVKDDANSLNSMTPAAASANVRRQVADFDADEFESNSTEKEQETGNEKNNQIVL
jgi:hypothetical protein